ncbi:hypothetical protein [Croceivirga radicis]|uniref:hypothetical protein n=1 Tax=Croceivirga radicis TaxID=1929488 RepID=UPI000255B382|nr:hypothetical protein [Croceivirga radicis]
MRYFILKLILFFTLFAMAYAFMVNKLSEGYVDMYYPKYTQDAGSLVIGLSRADQGIDPKTVADNINQEINLPLVNFAANQYYYGEVYLEAIKKKFSKKKDNGLFILSVSPGSFTAPIGFGAEGIKKMDEKAAIGKSEDFNSNPNYSYIINCYGQGLYHALFAQRAPGNVITHNNGWNEVLVSGSDFTLSDALKMDWKRQNLAYFQRRLPKEETKSYRLEWFGRTIEYLKDKGQVLLVRMPADKEIIDFENENSPNFRKSMDSITKIHQIPYLDYSENTSGYETYDGSHLHSESAIQFSTQLAKDMAVHIKK